MIELYDEYIEKYSNDSEYDLLALLSCFDGSEVKITVKSVDEEE